MKNSNKKGFTIVELVIVVAVIAILAAVMIPTFSGIIAKANLSADQQAVRQMNTALAMYAAENGAPKDVIEVKKALDAHFVNVDGGLVPVTQGYAFYWDSAKNEIVLVGTGDEVKDGWSILTFNEYGEKVTADSSDAIKEAFTKANNGTPVNVKLTADVNCTEALNLNDGSSLCVDLGGNKITFGNTTAAIMASNNANLTFKNGEISIGTSFQNKVAIANENASVTFENVKFNLDNYVYGVRINGLSDTTFIDCEITAFGVGVCTNSWSEENNGSRLIMKDTKVKTLDDSESAAVVINIYADVTIENCEFEGGAIGLYFRGTKATVKDTTITTRSATSPYATYGKFNEGPAAGIVAAAGKDGYENNGYYTFENVTINSASVKVRANAHDTDSVVTISGIPASDILEDGLGTTNIK